MSADIATLGLRLDANGFVSGAERAKLSLVDLGETSEKVTHKTEHFAMAAGFAIGSFASGSTRDLGSVLHALSGLGFAFGPIAGSITLAVSSIADAWVETTRHAQEEQQKQLEDLRKFRDQFQLEGKQIRLEVLQQREATLAAALAANQNRRTSRSGTNLVGDVIADYRDLAEANRISEELQRIRDESTALGIDLRHELGDNAKKAAEEAAKAFQKVLDAMNEAQDRAAADFRQWQAEMAHYGLMGRIIAGVAATSDPTIDAGIADLRSKFFNLLPDPEAWGASMRDTIRELQVELDRAKFHVDLSEWERQKREQALDKSGALRSVGQYGLDFAASRIGGPLGGVLGGAGGAALAGAGPWGIAAAGVMGFADSVLNAGQRAREAREALRLFNLSIEDLIAAARHETGQTSDADYAEYQTRRQYDEAIRALQERIRLEEKAVQLGFGAPTLEDDKRRLDELTRAEQELIEHRRKEADEIERLNAAVRNAPQGFYVEKYLRDIGYTGPRSYDGRVITTGGNGGSGGGGGGVTTVSVQAGAIQINGSNLSPTQLAKAVATGLDIFASSRGGVSMTRATAMELLS